ncbi:MAG: hypothetical protein RL456_1338 [Pseudomonadota bacterium]|jgi:DNA-binding NarL/FixJ family response regulator
MTRTLLADDHTLFRKGLRELLRHIPGVEVTAEAATADAALAQIEATELDLAIVDLGMPGNIGTEFVGRMRYRRPLLPILVLSMRNDPATVTAALKSGATGYVGKGCDFAVLRDAVSAVTHLRRYVDPAIAQALVLADPSTGAAAAHHRLTRREWQVLNLLLKGERQSSIARTLFLSTKTVSTHKTHVMSKLGVSSNAELIRYAVEHRLMPD